VAAPPSGGSRDPPARAALAALGNISLALLLRGDRSWHGEHTLCTDVLGRIGFPFSDWTLALHTDQDEFLGLQPVSLSLDGYRLAGVLPIRTTRRS